MKHGAPDHSTDASVCPLLFKEVNSTFHMFVMKSLCQLFRLVCGCQKELFLHR